MTPEGNPRMIFERLFGSGAPGERAESLKRRRKNSDPCSISSWKSARHAETSNLARQDKLDQYLTGVRENRNENRESRKFGTVQDPDIATPLAFH